MSRVSALLAVIDILQWSTWCGLPRCFGSARHRHALFSSAARAGFLSLRRTQKTSMSQIVLIRPCSTDYDEQGRIQGTLDIPLNAQGSAGAQQLVEQLRPLNISLIYSSPCQSAWQTASAIGEALDVKVKKVDSWQNVDHGLWQGMLVDDIRRKHPKVFRQWQEQPENICPPEGETLGDALQRAPGGPGKAGPQAKSRGHRPGRPGTTVGNRPQFAGSGANGRVLQAKD